MKKSLLTILIFHFIQFSNFGGAVSVANPLLGGSITAGGNLATDIATGNLPNFNNPWDFGKYTAGVAFDGISAGTTKTAVTGLAKKLGANISEQALVKVTSTAGKTVSTFGEDVALSSVSQYDVLVKPANLAFGKSLASEAGQLARGGVNAAEGSITGFGKHGINRAIERGFQSNDILKIIKEGTSTQAIGRFGIQTRYVLGGNTVILNSQGKLVTVFSNAKGTAKGLGKGFFIPLK